MKTASNMLTVIRVYFVLVTLLVAVENFSIETCDTSGGWSCPIILHYKRDFLKTTSPSFEFVVNITEPSKI